MPLNRFNPFRGPKYSTTRLRSGMTNHGQDGPLFEFLAKLATNDVVHFKDDFIYDASALNLDFWTVASGGGAGVATFQTTLASGGWIRGTTGTANGDTTTQTIVGPAIYCGTQNTEIAFRIKPVTAVTETRIEVGFVDAVASSTKTAINSLVTPTLNTGTAQAALFVYDHTGSTTTTGLYTGDAVFTAAKTAIVMPTAVAAATAFTVRIKLVGTKLMCWVDNNPFPPADTDYLTAATLLAPYALIRASNATSKSLDIDYVEIVHDRV